MGYVDDTAIYAVIPTPLLRLQGLGSLNHDMAVIESWCLKWHIWGSVLRRRTLRKLIVSMNTSSRVWQCSAVLSILSLFNYLSNEAACSLVCLGYPPIMPTESIYTLMSAFTRLSVLTENKINTIRGIDTVCRIEKSPAEQGLSCWKITNWTRFIFSVKSMMANQNQCSRLWWSCSCWSWAWEGKKVCIFLG